MAIIDAIPTQWQHHLKTCNNCQKNSTVSKGAQLLLKGCNIRLYKAISKIIDIVVRSKVEIIQPYNIRKNVIISKRYIVFLSGSL